MFRVQNRWLSTSTNHLAAAAKAVAKGKAQGFSKASTHYVKPSAKRITPTTLYRNWIDTMHTGRLNKNAPEITLPTFKPAKLDKSVNQVCKYSSKQLKLLRHIGGFKKNQFNELFAQPTSLIRSASIGKLLTKLENPECSKRIIITGEPGIGKSTLLTQLQAYAVEYKYLVLNIPYPELLLNGRNDFFWDEQLKSYVQPMYLKKWLTKILKGNNRDLLSSIKLQNKYQFAFTTLSGTQDIILEKDQHSIHDLLTTKINANLRGLQFKALIDEIYSQKGVPILFTIDNFSRLLTRSYTDYRDTNNKLIQTLDFQIAATIMKLASGEISLNNPKSCFAGAISGVDRTNNTLPVGLNQIVEDVYMRKYHYDPTYAHLLQKGKVEEFVLSKMSKDDVKLLLDYYSDANILPVKETQDKELEQLVDEKFFISGNGNPRELLKSLTLAYR